MMKKESVLARNKKPAINPKNKNSFIFVPLILMTWFRYTFNIKRNNDVSIPFHAKRMKPGLQAIKSAFRMTILL